MSTGGRLVVGVAVVGLLLGGTLVAAHYLLNTGDAAKAASTKADEVKAATLPAMIETPAETSGIARKHVAGGSGPAAVAPARGQDPGVASAATPPTGGPTSPLGTGGGDAAADEGLSLVRDRPVMAQKRLGEALRAGVDGPKGQQVRAALNALADKIQLAPQIVDGDPYAKQYKVVSGDSFTRIGKGHLIPPELIMKLNRRSTTNVAAGEQIKILQGPMTIEIFKGRTELQAWCGDACLRVYSVAVGANNKTPDGTFVVTKKLKNPPYQPSDKTGAAFKASGAPDNPLGTRWIEFKKSFGIHGTIDPTSIGKDVSDGCVRMLNKDVEELYDMVVEGSKVTIRP